MGANDLLASPEDLHPALWRASQLARSSTKCISTDIWPCPISSQEADGRRER